MFARALAQSPADRYATALAFAEALHEACDRAASAEPQLPLAGPMAPAPPERPAAPQVVALSPVPEPPAPVDPAPAVIPWVKPEGLSLSTPDTALQARTVDFLHHLIDFAAACGAEVLVHGSPAQRALHSR